MNKIDATGSYGQLEPFTRSIARSRAVGPVKIHNCP